VEKVVQNGLMTGMGDGRFEPGGDLSIAQTLVLAYQIHSRESGDPLPQTSGGLLFAVCLLRLRFPSDAALETYK